MRECSSILGSSHWTLRNTKSDRNFCEQSAVVPDWKAVHSVVVQEKWKLITCLERGAMRWKCDASAHYLHGSSISATCSVSVEIVMAQDGDGRGAG